MILSSQVSSLL